MGQGTLPPEARLVLGVQLDRLKAAGERCRDGLRALSDGSLSNEGYLEVLRQQHDAQLDWEHKTRSLLSGAHDRG